MSASAGTGRSGVRRPRAAARSARPSARAPSISAPRVSHRIGESSVGTILRNEKVSLFLPLVPTFDLSKILPMQWRVRDSCLGVWVSIWHRLHARLSRVRNKCWKVHRASSITLCRPSVGPTTVICQRAMNDRRNASSLKTFDFCFRFRGRLHSPIPHR